MVISYSDQVHYLKASDDTFSMLGLANEMPQSNCAKSDLMKAFTPWCFSAEKLADTGQPIRKVYNDS